MERLTSLSGLPATVETPRYDRRLLGPGILHLGLGAFHRAHQAPYTDDAIAAAGGDWGIEGVSLRSPDAAARLRPQNGLYSLVVRGPEGARTRVIGCLLAVHVAPRTPELVLERLADPAVRVNSLAVTEKAYGIDAETGGLDETHPAIRVDLATPDRPAGTVGLIVAGLALRRRARAKPFTPLCCDNLTGNGAVLRRLVLAFAERTDPDLARWIAAEVSFPSTMVDRITPASTEATCADAARLLGRGDRAAVETEPFSQWVIEDAFTTGRPAWDASGAVFAEDVTAYEKMKLRMLNGVHSLLAYLGHVAGHEFVRDTMRDPALARIARRHMGRAAATLDPVPGIDTEAYADSLIARFANPAMAHPTYQIAMDGTQKLPQRLLEPASEALRRGLPVETFALAVAAWIRYALGEDDSGRAYVLRDPREREIARSLEGAPREASVIAAALFGLSGLFPAVLVQSLTMRQRVEHELDLMLRRGVRAAIETFEAQRWRG